MLRKSYAITMSLILLSIQSTAYSSTSLQKLSRTAAHAVKRTGFAAKSMSSYNYDNSKRQQVIARNIIDSLWASPLYYEHIYNLEQAFANRDLQQAQTIVNRCTKTFGKEHPEIIKINTWFHEYNCIEAARQI